MNHRIIAPIYATVVAAILAIAYIMNNNDYNKIDAVGSYISGVFSSLSLLWLVIGHLLQREDIIETRQILIKQTEILQRSMAASEREIFFVLYEETVPALYESALRILQFLKNNNKIIIPNDIDKNKYSKESAEEVIIFIEGIPDLTTLVEDAFYTPGSDLFRYNIQNFLASVHAINSALEGIEENTVMLRSRTLFRGRYIERAQIYSNDWFALKGREVGAGA